MRERTIYWIVAGVFGVLLIVMLAAWNYDRQNEQADAKAQELVAAFEARGLTAPDPDKIARVLGDDGGFVCATADSGLVQGTWKLRLAVGGEFYQRAARLPPQIRDGVLLTVGVYCPEKLPNVEDFFQDWDFDDLVSN